MHPVLFSLFGLEIKTYGVIAAVAFLTGIYLSAKLGEREGIKKDSMLDLGLIIIICSLAGARLLYIMIAWKYYLKNPLDMFKVWEGGLVYFGGFLLSVGGVFWWLKRHKLPFLKVTDILVPFTALGHAIARVGCYFSGCCYGRPDVHGVVFPCLQDNIARVPVQIYESAANFFNFLVLILFYRFAKRKEGDVFYLYLLNYGVIRMIMEMFFRGDPERGTVFFLSTSAFISVFLILAGAAGLIYNRVAGKGSKAE
jgi:phosphatidylglycerol---prolipoprotein diacylglyceryl transferase